MPAPGGVVGEIPRDAGDLVVVQAVDGREASPQAVAANLARGVRAALAAPCDTLLLTGGATAEAVLGAMGLDRVRLLGECLPGLPVAVADGLTIVAKSGGFGDRDALVRVARMIGGRWPLSSGEP